MYPKVFIKSERVKNIQSGHPWIFSHAIEKKDNLKSGDLCEIYSKNVCLGIGYYNAETDIAVRILTRKLQKIDENFFVSRFEELKKERDLYVKDTNAYRMIFGESDGIPGLIADKYADTLVLQFHTLGIELLRNYIVEALKKVFKPDCIFLKESVHSKKIEKTMSSSPKLLHGKLKEEIVIIENNFSFLVNIVRGQKTGFFLDQRLNRKSIMEFTKNKKVINFFSYTGGFSVYAAKNAKEVVSVDISKDAIIYARNNFQLNNFDVNKHKFIAEDAFEYLKNLKKDYYDMIILDPPSFARRKSQVPQAIKAYITLNSKALEKLPEGGILVSSSCTAHIDELTFIKILHQSAVNTGCSLKVLHSATQPFDHAYNLHFPEGRYLKFFVLLKGKI